MRKLDREYQRLLAKAIELQRNGDIQGFAQMSQRAEDVAKRIEAMQRER